MWPTQVVLELKEGAVCKGLLARVSRYNPLRVISFEMIVAILQIYFIIYKTLFIFILKNQEHLI